MNVRLFLPRLILLWLCISGTALATPMKDAKEHLEKAQALLEQPKVPKPAQYQNALSRNLSQALSNLEQAKENKGSQLALAIKAVKTAQAEIEAGVDTKHREAALVAVKDALKRCENAWKFNH